MSGNPYSDMSPVELAQVFIQGDNTSLPQSNIRDWLRALAAAYGKERLRDRSTATARALVDADGAGCETCNDLASMTMQ